MPTHGSLTKAGKARGQTPKIPKSVFHKRDFPRLKRRRAFEKRFILGRVKERRRW